MTRSLPAAVLLWLVAGPLATTSSAGVIPIIWGHGESVTHLGKLPSEAQRAVARDLGMDVSVGYLYSHCHLYYADLWTWNGRHVLYNGDKYWTPDDAGWQQLLGDSVESKYGKPFLYRFPLAILLICAVISAYGFRPIFFPSTAERLKRLHLNPAYMAAIETVFPADKYPLRTDYDEHDFEQAIESLTAAGISAAKARKNLRLLADEMIFQRTTQIATVYQIAEQLAAIGQTAEAISHLEQLAANLPPTDPRQQHTADLVSKLRGQIAASDQPAGSL